MMGVSDNGTCLVHFRGTGVCLALVYHVTALSVEHIPLATRRGKTRSGPSRVVTARCGPVRPGFAEFRICVTRYGARIDSHLIGGLHQGQAPSVHMTSRRTAHGQPKKP